MQEQGNLLLDQFQFQAFIYIVTEDHQKFIYIIYTIYSYTKCYTLFGTKFLPG